jgi:hypothetical protein
VIVECPWTQLFWATVREITGRKLPRLHPLTWVTDLLQRTICSTEAVAVFVCGGWSLWTSRNNRVHGRNQWNPMAATKHVARIMEDMLCLRSRGEHGEPRPTARWQSPEEGWVKINSHGSFDCCRACGAAAAVLCNHSGQVLGRKQGGMDRCGKP